MEKQAIVAVKRLEYQGMAIHVCTSYLDAWPKPQPICFAEVSRLGPFRS